CPPEPTMRSWRRPRTSWSTASASPTRPCRWNAAPGPPARRSADYTGALEQCRGGRRGARRRGPGARTRRAAMRLYTFTVTPNNRKVEAFVKHFDLDVDIHHVSFKDQETKSPAYLAINPMGKVPALVDGDFRLWE